jgi:hypothetical protein
MEWTRISRTWKAPNNVRVQIRGIAYRNKDASRMPEDQDVDLGKDETIIGINFLVCVVSRIVHPIPRLDSMGSVSQNEQKVAIVTGATVCHITLLQLV